MKSFYDQEIDFLEVVETGHDNVGEEITKNLTLFYTEDDESFIGYALHGANRHMDDLVHVPADMRLAGILRVLRGTEGLTQKEFSDKTGISFRQVQRLEACERNAGLDILSRIVNAFPQWDFSILMRPQEQDESA